MERDMYENIVKKSAWIGKFNHTCLWYVYMNDNGHLFDICLWHMLDVFISWVRGLHGC